MWTGRVRGFERRQRSSRNSVRRTDRRRLDAALQLDAVYTGPTETFAPMRDSPDFREALARDSLAFAEAGRPTARLINEEIPRGNWTTLYAAITTASKRAEHLHGLADGAFCDEAVVSSTDMARGMVHVEDAARAALHGHLKARAIRASLRAYTDTAIAPRRVIVANARRVSNLRDVGALLLAVRRARALVAASDAAGVGVAAVRVAEEMDALVEASPHLNGVHALTAGTARVRERRATHLARLRERLAADMTRFVTHGLADGCDGVARGFAWRASRAREPHALLLHEVERGVARSRTIQPLNAGAAADRAYTLWSALRAACDRVDTIVLREWISAVDVAAAADVRVGAALARRDLRVLVDAARIGRSCHARVDEALSRHLDRITAPAARIFDALLSYKDAWVALDGAGAREAYARLRAAADGCVARSGVAVPITDATDWATHAPLDGAIAGIDPLVAALSLVVTLADHDFADGSARVAVAACGLVRAWTTAVARGVLSRAVTRVRLDMGGAARAVASVRAAAALARTLAGALAYDAGETLLACERSYARLCGGVARSIAAIVRARGGAAGAIARAHAPPLSPADVDAILAACDPAVAPGKRNRRNSGFV